MERIIANFCDEAMLWRADEYTDEAGNVLLDRLAADFFKKFEYDNDAEDWDDADYIIYDYPDDKFNSKASFEQMVADHVRLWWAHYPLAFQYANY